jgi:hypothetical protein
LFGAVFHDTAFADGLLIAREDESNGAEDEKNARDEDLRTKRGMEKGTEASAAIEIEEDTAPFEERDGSDETGDFIFHGSLR